MKKNIDSYLSRPSLITKELSAILTNVKSPIIFDIGACECEDSIRYKRMFPQSRVFAFEPLKHNFQKCLNHIEKYQIDIQARNVALSDTKGTATFYVSSGQPSGADTSEWDYGNKSSSLLPPVKENSPEWLEFNKEETVETDTLENFLVANSLNGIDFIHMDVQGAELLVLNGAGPSINKIRSIWLEVNDIDLYESQPKKQEVEDFMSKNGFYKVKDTVDGVGDQLYVNSRVLSKIRYQINSFWHSLTNI